MNLLRSRSLPFNRARLRKKFREFFTSIYQTRRVGSRSPTALAIIALGSLTGGSVGRYYDGGHTVAGAILGSGADMTGVTAVYGSITNRDIASGNHLDLTDAQRRGMMTEGGIQLLQTVGGGKQAGRGMMKGRSPAAAKPASQQAPPAPRNKALPPTEAAPPPCQTTNSGAGKAKAGETPSAAGETTCFPAGTMLRTPTGWKAIEKFQADDEVVSRPENRPEADNTVRKVVKLLTRSGVILELWVDGRKLEATKEHPFWVIGRGWVVAAFLKAGDEFLTSDNRPVTLERVVDPGKTITVYNLEIEADHTYFVGGEGWKVDVWSHNHNRIPLRVIEQPPVGVTAPKPAVAPLTTPQVTDPTLTNIVTDLYKGTKGRNPTGNGTTADAVRNELLTGNPTKGDFHSKKAQDNINALEKWLANNPTTGRDRLVAQSLWNDLILALAGR